MKEDNLKITVVTVCYNAAKEIEETILSVIDQTYQDIEYIIIDGGSTDGTIDIIKRYAEGGSEEGKHNHRITKWISEPDHGIYDAMNKGIAMATGDYINFMNAGDSFYTSNIVKTIFEDQNHTAKVIYGSAYIQYPYGNYIVSPDNLQKIKKTMTLCHQSVFTKTIEAKKHPFRKEYGLVADHGALLEIFNESPDSFYEYNGVIAVYDAKYGVSSRNAVTSYRHQAHLTGAKDSIFRKFRVYVRGYMPDWIIIPLGRLFFKFNRRYKRI